MAQQVRVRRGQRISDIYVARRTPLNGCFFVFLTQVSIAVSFHAFMEIE